MKPETFYFSAVMLLWCIACNLCTKEEERSFGAGILTGGLLAAFAFILDKVLP